MPGQTVRLTLLMEVGSARNAGFYLGASAGTLTPVAGEDTKVGGETGITHTRPIAVSNGRATVRADWKAPDAPGGVDFRAAVVSGNGDSRSAGDGAESLFFSMPFGCSGGAKYYRDFDGDGYGYDETNYTLSCGQPEGYADKAGDCDDNDAKIFPGAQEICNRRDDNCNGMTDEGLGDVMLYPDKDGDGWGRRGAADEVQIGCGTERGWGIEGTDCDDMDPRIFPGAMEICNLKDDNCNGRFDEGARADCGVGWCRRLAPSCDANTCIPGRAQTERCNLLDDDCDGQTDEDPDALCEDNSSTCFEGRCIPHDEAPAATGGSTGGRGETGGGSDAGGSGGSEGGAGCTYLPHETGTSVVWLGLLAAALAWARRRR